VCQSEEEKKRRREEKGKAKERLRELDWYPFSYLCLSHNGNSILSNSLLRFRDQKSVGVHR
jgi:hypothetical protein